MKEVIEVLNKVHDFLGILIRENLIKEAPYLDEEPMLKVSDLADDLWEVIHKKLPCNMEEQSKRYEEYCKSHSINGRCVNCPLWQMRLLGINCAIAWANLPSDALEDNKEIANEES